MSRMTRARAAELLDRLHAQHPDAHIELDWTTPLELLVATILSAQCTDKRVNEVTPALFARFPMAADYLSVEPAELEEMIRPTGFFRSKTRSIREASAQIVERHGGEVPADFDALVALHGVGRKTAAVVASNAFGIREAIAVDTHVLRVYPRERWLEVSDVLIFHGRRVCAARRPRCEECVVADTCPSSLVAGSPAG